MTRAGAPCAAACLVVLLLGCRTPFVPPRPAAPLDAESLVASLHRQGQVRLALRGLAKVSVESPNGSGRSKQVVMAERPDRLRVEFLGFLNQTVALFATDGRRYGLFRAEDRYHREGSVHDGVLWDAVRVDLAPGEAVRLLLGDPGPLEELAVASAGPWDEPGLRVALADALGTVRRVLAFDEAALLRRVEARTERGEVAWVARFDDYRNVDGAAFAHAIELDVPPSETRARLGFRQVELNPALPPGTFELRLPGVSSGSS